MILAIGIMVDDSIVVVENVQRIMRENALEAREATRRAMAEITGPVLLPGAACYLRTGIVYAWYHRPAFTSSSR